MDMALLLVPSHDTFFVGVLIGVAPDVATSTESHVNGHGSTIGARHDTYFVGVLIGVAPDVATSTESHVNGRGSTIGVQPLYLFLQDNP